MKLRPVGVRVVPREHFNFMTSGFRFRTFGIKPWGRGHVESFLCTNAFTIVYKHKRGGLCLLASLLNAEHLQVVADYRVDLFAAPVPSQ